MAMASFTYNVHNRRTLNFSHITQWSITQVSKSFADFEFQSGGGGAAIKIAILWNNLSVWHPHPHIIYQRRISWLKCVDHALFMQIVYLDTE